jgi:hypothetical protein
MNRRKRRGLTKFEELILNSPTCLLWPACSCHETICHWQGLLDDPDETFTLEQLEAAEVCIYFSVACAGEHCPNPETKAYAKRQFARLTERRERIAAARNAPTYEPSFAPQFLRRQR